MVFLFLMILFKFSHKKKYISAYSVWIRNQFEPQKEGWSTDAELLTKEVEDMQDVRLS